MEWTTDVPEGADVLILRCTAELKAVQVILSAELTPREARALAEALEDAASEVEASSTP